MTITNPDVEGVPVEGVRVLRTVHAPGIGLDRTRTMSHRMFLEAVEGRSLAVAAEAWKSFLEHGRCALFVCEDQWMDLVTDTNSAETFPCGHIRLGTLVPGSDDPFLTSGLAQMLSTYDPELDVILVGQHRKGAFFSAYWLRTGSPPPVAFSEMAGRVGA